jgi:hypothetical protein
LHGVVFQKKEFPSARPRGKGAWTSAPSAGVVAAVNRSDVDAPPTPHLGFRVVETKQIQYVALI